MGLKVLIREDRGDFGSERSQRESLSTLMQLMPDLSESIVEDLALDWFRALGYDVMGRADQRSGPHFLRTSYGDVTCGSAVRGALRRLNSDLSEGAVTTQCES